MSATEKRGRFSYLSTSESTLEQDPRQDIETFTQSRSHDGSTEPGSGGDESSLTRQDRKSSSHDARSGDLTSVPKGEGRMKQERSQLNVRVPTTLKRRASAKAMLEGKDIGTVVEELLREYLDRMS